METLEAIRGREPLRVGRSKILYRVGDDECLVELVPSLTSYTHGRHDYVAGTEVLRLDFFELAAARLAEVGVSSAFLRRVGPNLYLARYCVEDIPFEVIVKNFAQGSTTRKYPGLFPEGHRFVRPVVKFDYRTDPEDQPIAEDYIRECGHDPEYFRYIARAVNDVLRSWLLPNRLLDFCLVFGRDATGAYHITSEVSPDGMRLRSPDDKPLDKDLFRAGRGAEEILATWSGLVHDLRERELCVAS